MTVETATSSGPLDTPSAVHVRDRDRGEAHVGADALAQLDTRKLSVTLTDAPKPLPDFNTLKFGVTFSDHMAIASFDPVLGWSAPEVKPYGPLVLDPASSCFQYSDSVFEGMKAYLGVDGKVRLFRPDMNMRRMERSVARLALPSINGDAVLELIKRLVETDKRWIPSLSGWSLYLRPTVIGTRATLGIVPADQAILYVLASPSCPLFSRPVSLLAAPDIVRAWPGGTGADKFSGNYSPGFLPQREAVARGYDQVLWLFGPERYVTEGGTMNVFAVLDRADGDGWDVITPPLDGTILPGVTRASCLALAADPAFHSTFKSFVGRDGVERAGVRLHPAERAFTIPDLVRWSTDGTLREVLCVGTAAIVVAVRRIGFEGCDICPPAYPDDENGLGPVGRALRATIMAVQEGRAEYRGWGVVVCDSAR